MLESSKKQILCMLGACECEVGSPDCLWPKVCDRDLEYVEAQIEKIIKLEAKTMLMQKETKKSIKQAKKPAKKVAKSVAKKGAKKPAKTTKKSTK